MSALHRCIYTSTLSSADLRCIPHILRTAKQNNVRLDITSLLIFDGLRFCQYLEGTESSLDSMLQRIEADTRHIDMTIKGRGTLGDRRFPDWHIAFALTLDAEALDGFRSVNDRSAFDGLEALFPPLDLGPISDDPRTANAP